MNLKLMCLAVMVLQFLPLAFAFGGAEGHGGGAFVCRDTQGQIKENKTAIELIDFWEASHIRHLEIARNDNVFWMDQVENVRVKLSQWNPKLSKIVDGFFYSMEAAFFEELFKKNDQGDIGFGFPQEQWPKLIKKDCPPEWVALYNDQNESLITNNEIFERLGRLNTDLAGLFTHEIICRSLRTLSSDQDPERCRKIVAFLFSNEPVPKYLSYIDKNLISCETDDSFYSFYLFEKENRLKIRFRMIDGNPQMIRWDIDAETSFFRNIYREPSSSFSVTAGKYFSSDNVDSEKIKVEDGHDSYLVSFMTLPMRFPRVRCHPFINVSDQNMNPRH